MRKHVNKERCTRIRFVKCNEVCLLYDKVQRAYAEHIDKDKEVKSFEVNVILEGNDTVVKGGWNPPEKYTSDFLICFQNGNKAIREAVFRKQLDKPSMIETLEYSRRYWSAHGIDDWGIIVEKGQGEN